MSSIPSSAMPHAKAHHDEPAKTAPKAGAKAAAGDWIDTATDAAKSGFATATEAVKEHPKTALAVGAAVIAGIAAAVAGPALLAKEPEPAKKPAPKKSAKK
ncbi:hypothetical protein [Sphingomonas sp. R86521]|uniref:hypothetical protein n=1 Tax=Sphingomonas sp. R86521 TaxID=3093860 RepID=UPI0036D2EE90